MSRVFLGPRLRLKLGFLGSLGHSMQAAAVCSFETSTAGLPGADTGPLPSWFLQWGGPSCLVLARAVLEASAAPSGIVSLLPESVFCSTEFHEGTGRGCLTRAPLGLWTGPSHQVPCHRVSTWWTDGWTDGQNWLAGRQSLGEAREEVGRRGAAYH